MGKHYYIFKDGSVVNQVICALIINIASFSLGAELAWIHRFSEFHDTLEDSIVVTKQWILVINFCGYMIGCFGIILMDIMSGRTAYLLFTSLAYSAGWVLLICWPQVPWVHYVEHGIKSIAIGSSFLICPIYTKEISQDSIRGVLGSLVSILEELGKLFAEYFLEFKTIKWVLLATQVVHILLIFTLPDSPSFLLHSGNIEKTKKALSWLRCRKLNDPKLSEELENMKKEEEFDKTKEGSRFIALYKDSTLFKALKMILFLNVARLFSGMIPYFLFYHNLKSEIEDSSIMFSEIMQIGSLIVCIVVEIFGRKMLLIGTFISASINMILIASMCLAKNYGIIISQWLIIFSFSMLQLCECVSLTWMPIITTEMFSFKYRGIVLSSTVIITYTTSVLMTCDFIRTLPATPMFFTFAVLCVLTSIYVWAYVPELRNKTIVELYEELQE